MDDYDERFRQHEDILAGLARMLAAQHTFNEQQVAVNARLTAAIERLDVTQARIEALLARLFPTGENGRDA
jgi:hypothetical protein